MAYTTSNPAKTATALTLIQATTNQPLTSTSVPALAQPTANQPLMSTLVPLFAQHIVNQTLSLGTLRLNLKGCIFKIFLAADTLAIAGFACWLCYTRTT